MNIDTEHLRLRSEDRTGQAKHICLALAHNERNLLAAFLDHYRAFQDITFVFVDDRSTDGSSEFLESQPDVTVFVPKDGSTYAAHKREWRGLILDQVAIGRWVVAPDVDELMVWHDAPTRSFSDLIVALEDEGSEALYAIMLDMYADKPLAQHVYQSGDLSIQFPFFDDPRKDASRTWMERGASRYLAAWPLPKKLVLGGMRQRMVDTESPHVGLWQTLSRRLFGRLGDHRSSGGRLARAFMKQMGPNPPVNLTKIPLVKWQKGLRFNGGAHSLNKNLTLSSERAALLHYPITRGLDGFQEVISRGQHACNSLYYKNLLDVASKNPMYEGSSTFTGVSDLTGIVVGPRGVR